MTDDTLSRRAALRQLTLKYVQHFDRAQFPPEFWIDLEAALRLSAGADEFLPNGRRCEWQDNIGRWWPVTIVGWTPSTYDAVLDDGSEARGYAPGRFRAAAPRHETGE